MDPPGEGLVILFLQLRQLLMRRGKRDTLSVGFLYFSHFILASIASWLVLPPPPFLLMLGLLSVPSHTISYSLVESRPAVAIAGCL